MTTKGKAKSTQITLGELVVAITDRARRVAGSERDAYRLAGFVLNRMLRPLPEVATGHLPRFELNKTFAHALKYL